MGVFADRLKEARIIRGYTQDDLANLLDCSPQTLSGYENGRRFPDEEMLKNISTVLNFSPNYFLGAEEEKQETITEESLTMDYIKKFIREGKITGPNIDKDTFEVLKRLIEIDVINVKKKLEEDAK